jgi:2-polyprenyl-3-methyl-5-hydroxy-6-metoxy-1,4-benzoquinol methylase
VPQLDDNAGLLTGYLARRRYAAARPHLRGRVLDVACASGALTEWCQPDSYIGVDIDERSIEIARERYPKFRFETELPFEETFDTIAVLALIEHLTKPAEFLIDLQPMLRPDGLIVLTTPHPRLEWAHDLGAKVHLFSREAQEEHETLIDRRRMDQLALDAGLEVFHFDRFLFGANQLFLLRACSSAD